jgi:hypothetical protein
MSRTYEVKPVHRRLQGFADNELKQIRRLPAGSRLEQAATYFDLAHLASGEFTATGERQAEPHQWMVAKKEVPYQLWSRLLEVETLERVG